ncbi:unnamed protein product, partial [Ectocarpus sp. 4 AP-2014]
MDGAVSDDEFSLEPRADQEGGDRDSSSHEDELALRAALHYSVGEVCSGENGKIAMTGSAVSTLAEVVFKFSESLALDLRVFAKHGKRAVVGVDDVKCAARKDPKLVEKLAGFESAMNLNAGKKKAAASRKKKDKDQQQHQHQQRGAGGATLAEDEGEQEGERRTAPKSVPTSTAESSAMPLARQVATRTAAARTTTTGGGGGGGGSSSGSGKAGSDNFVDLLLDD